MKTLKNSYGTIHIVNKETSPTYQVQFFNPLLKKISIKQAFRRNQEAVDFLIECNYNFFEEHSYLLPKGISIRRKNKTFVFTIRVKGKNIFVSSSKDIDDVCNDKFNLLKSFLS
jgi:DUF1365 family protein